MIIFGIDPGLNGAIAVFNNNKIKVVFEIPVMTEGKKNKKQLNSAHLVKLLRDNLVENEEVSVVVEQVNAMPGQGVTSMFNFGQTFGAIKGICASLGLPIFLYVRLNGKSILTLSTLKKTPAELRQSKCIPLYLASYQGKKMLTKPMQF